MIWMDVDTALSEVPVNYAPLTDDTDFKTRETTVAYNQAGMDLVWNFVTTAGAFTQTAVTPTTGGDYDWTNQGKGHYTIEIPASGGASINNDTEGFGWFSGYATGILPWVGPIIGFRAAGLNDKAIDSAYDTNRGFAGTGLPAAAADGAGGIPISDAGGLDLDSKLANTNEVTAARMGALTDWINGGRLDLLLDAIKAITDQLNFTGTYVNAQVKAKDNIDFGALEKASLNAATPQDSSGVTSLLTRIVGTLLAGNHNAQSGDAYSRLGAPAGASISADVAENQADLNTLLSRLVGTILAGNHNAQSGDAYAIVNNVTYGLSALKTLIDAITTHLTDVKGTGFVKDTHSLFNILADVTGLNGDAMRGTDGANTTVPDAAGTAAGLHTTTDALIAALNNLNSADVQAAAAAALVAIHLDHLLAADYDPASKPGVATALLNELVENDSGVSRFTENALEQAPSGTGGDATLANQTDIIDKLKGIMSKAYTLLTAVGTFTPANDSLEAIRDRGDAAWITGSGLSGSRTLTITVQDGDGNNVPEAAVEIWDSAGTTFYERKASNSSGQTVHNPDDGIYTVKVHKGGYSFDNIQITISADTSQTITGERQIPDDPSSPSACRVYEYVFMPDGITPVSEIKAMAKIVSLPEDSGSMLHTGEEIEAIYNSSTGLIYWDIVQGASVEFSIPNFGYRSVKTIPSTSTARLYDIS